MLVLFILVDFKETFLEMICKVVADHSVVAIRDQVEECGLLTLVNIETTISTSKVVKLSLYDNVAFS